MKRQNAVVLRLLQEHGTVSARDLLWHFGISRAAARIWELKREGHDIETIRHPRLPDGTVPMASYRLLPGSREERAASGVPHTDSRSSQAAGSIAGIGFLPEPVVPPRGSGRRLPASAG